MHDLEKIHIAQGAYRSQCEHQTDKVHKYRANAP